MKFGFVLHKIGRESRRVKKSSEDCRPGNETANVWPKAGGNQQGHLGSFLRRGNLCSVQKIEEEAEEEEEEEEQKQEEMKAERKKEVLLKSSRVPGLEGIQIILRYENSVVEEDDCDPEESVGKYKFGGQLEKQMKSERKDPISDLEKVNSVDIGALLKKFKQKCAIVEESSCELVPRSPMRTQECHHCCKPYQYPHSTSRAYGGVTRVVEEDRTCGRRSFTCSQTPGSVSEDGYADDVDLCDINRWLNLCKRDPKFLNDFVEGCKKELTNREISNVRHYRTTRSVCSNVSSQYTSPAQSPSEQDLTSPESVDYDDSSLYFSKSPNIQSKFDSIDIRNSSNKSVSSDGEERGKSPRTTTTTAGGRTFFDSNQVNVLPNIGINETEYNHHTTTNSNSNNSTTTLPNIGTVMLNLVENPYESTIDLNQFANVCDTYTENGSSGGDSPEEQTSSTVERDSLNKKLDPKAKENAWARISQLNIDLLGKGDNEGDTQLMILLVSEKVTLEYVYVIVERLLKEHPEYLSCRNELNQDALYLASFKLVWEPLVASYIAEALVRGKQDVNMKYDNGNTLLHCLAKKGDSHVRVLERLVKLRHPNQSPVFDVNKKNNRGFTPLHIACEVHKREVVHMYQTVRVLVENGADCTAKDYKDENTPLHTLINESCDTELLRVLLESANRMRSKDGVIPTTVPNRQGNTALHLACGRNTLRLHHQKDAIEILLRHGAMIQLKNINGCVPSVLVDSTRKQEIKVILHSYRQK